MVSEPEVKIFAKLANGNTPIGNLNSGIMKMITDVSADNLWGMFKNGHWIMLGQANIRYWTPFEVKVTHPNGINVRSEVKKVSSKNGDLKTGEEKLITLVNYNTNYG